MRSGEPVLTIGVPVFNGERYLAETLAGIRAQTFGDFEVVVADNASSDATASIAMDAAAADPRIRYLRRERNIGLVPNYNRLFTETTGEFFAWHDADDVAAPTFFDTCVRLLRREPDAAAAFSEIDLISESGRSLPTRPERVRADHPDRAVRFGELASFDHYCQFAYGVFRRPLLARTRLMLPFWGSDRLLLAELALQGRMLRDPGRLYSVRQHTARVTRDGRAHFYSGLSSPRRGTTLVYARELWRAIDHAGVPASERGRVRRAWWRWAAGNPHRLARGCAGALAQATAHTVVRDRKVPAGG